MTGKRVRSTRNERADILRIVHTRLHEGADSARATKKAKQAHSRERWLGVHARTVSAAQRHVAAEYSRDPDSLFDMIERLFHGARFREEKELALALLEDAAEKLTEAHLVRCLEWFPRLADADLIDKLAHALGATVAELPIVQRRLTEFARHMNPLHRRAAVAFAAGSLHLGTKALRTALLVAELATRDRSPQVQEALCRLLAGLAREAPKSAMPFLARFADDLPASVYEAAIGALPEPQRRQLAVDRERGQR